MVSPELALVDGSNGNVVERCVYDPYGKVKFYDLNWGSPSDSSRYDNEILYCGYRYDPETGLYHIRERMYHPTLGRWLQREPPGYEYVDGMNLYEYVGSMPLMFYDPFGLKAWYEHVGEVAKAIGGFFLQILAIPFSPIACKKAPPKPQPTEEGFCCCDSLDVRNVGSSTAYIDSESRKTGITYYGTSVMVVAVAKGRGQGDRCSFERWVKDYVVETKGGRRVVSRSDQAWTADHPLPDTSRIKQTGETWTYTNKDAPSLGRTLNLLPASKKATFMFQVRDSSGNVNLQKCSVTFTIEIKIDARGKTTALMNGVAVNPV